MTARSISLNGAGSGSGSARDFPFPGEYNALNGQSDFDFLGVGASTASGADRFVPFLHVHRFLDSVAIVAGGKRAKESVDRSEVSGVGSQKRKQRVAFLEIQD